MNTKPADPNTPDLINQVTNFYQQYLDCSPEQLDLLALWTMHTHIIPGAPFSPSLNICSRQKHSGKTVCLQLLGLLCDTPSMHTAAAPSLLLHQLTGGFEPFNGTLLLDDCDATFGKTRMNIKLQGLFTARFQQDARFTVRVKEDGEYSFDDRLVFFPAAFAGNGRLHPCLAERSIQISLGPKKTGSPCRPFRFYAAHNSSRSVRQTLSDWGNANHERFEKMAPYKEDQFPPELSWRHRDCAEPLLHVADFIGGDWPNRARQALVNAFALAAFEDFYSSKQILSDIRDVFFEKGNPEWISSADLLSVLHTLDNRTWDDWTKGKPMQPKALAHLLAPFGISPRNHRTGAQAVPKGYYRQDLEPAWTSHLPAQIGSTTFGRSEGIGAFISNPVAAELQDFTPSQSKLVESSQKSPATVPVAANVQDSIPDQPKLAASSQKLAASSVAANVQNSKPVVSGQKLAADPATSQKPATIYGRTLGQVWSGAFRPSPPSTPVVNNARTGSIGHKIMALIQGEDEQKPNY